MVVTPPPDEKTIFGDRRAEWHGIVVKPHWPERGFISVAEEPGRIPSRVRRADVRRITKEEYDERERAFQERMAATKAATERLAKVRPSASDDDHPFTVGDVKSLIWSIVIFGIILSLFGVRLF